MSTPRAIFGNYFVPQVDENPSNQIALMSVPRIPPLSGITPEQAITHHLEDNGQSIQWLANRVQLSRTYVHQVLKGKPPNKKRLTPQLREKINSVLKTNY